MDVGNISHPQLVYTIHCTILDQVGINPKVVVAIGCADPFTLPRSTAPVFLTHDSGNSLVVDESTFTLKLFGYPAISVLGKVQANVLHTLNQYLIRRLFLRLIIICSSGQFHQFTPSFNTLDEGAVFGNGLCFFLSCLRLLRTAFLRIHFQCDFAQKPLKFPDASFQFGFPGWLRIELAVGILFFPSVKLAGGNIVTPVPFSNG
jgi:hypothetical protein